MQIIGFAVRLLSSLLWIQMYRLGASSVESTIYRYADFDLRNSLLSPSSQVPARQNSGSEDILGGSIYDPACYSSIFEDVKDNRYAYGVDNQIIGDDGKSTSAPGTSPLKLCNNISSPVINVSRNHVSLGCVMCLEHMRYQIPLLKTFVFVCFDFARALYPFFGD
eukprot:TRINITY_DN14699_c0_g1_i4.p1 TRINITY_DN14699_c0_g1~~TRINITY_DN14699_c0_g1_i4.p1  ORF type:complete len:165 (-),score=18.13 TRINITY_DN14699_c0_g1_i4:1852-2346(-)